MQRPGWRECEAWTLLPLVLTLLCGCCNLLTRRGLAQKGSKPSSPFRGVTQHRRSRRWEAHIWMGGKQVRVGASKVLKHVTSIANMTVAGSGSMTSCKDPELASTHSIYRPYRQHADHPCAASWMHVVVQARGTGASSFSKGCFSECCWCCIMLT